MSMDENKTEPSPEEETVENPPAFEKTEGSDGAEQALTLEEQLVAAQSKLKEYLDGLQRERADFANYKKRIERERDEADQRATVKVMQQFLLILDDFDRALDNPPPDNPSGEWLEGVKLIQRKFRALLENAGVREINPLGEAFDPALHEAVSSEPSDEHETGQVTAVLQKGYLYKDTVLRPALVRVAS